MSLIERDYMRTVRNARARLNGQKPEPAPDASGEAPVDGPARSRAGRRVDPVVAGLVATAVVAIGGLGVWGATAGHGGDAGAAPPVSAAAQDAASQQAIALANDDGSGDAVTATPADASRAVRRGVSSDPFAAAQHAAAKAAAPASTGSGASGSSATGSSSSSSTAATSTAVTSTTATTSTPAASSAGATTGTSGTASAASGSTTTTKKPASSATLARLADARAAKKDRVSVRVRTSEANRSRSKLRLGRAVPTPGRAMVRLRGTQDRGRIVLVSLADGVHLSGKQSPGTRCVRKATKGSKRCLVVRVRTGRVAIVRRGEAGDMAAVRILSVTRAGKRIAGK